MSLPLSRMPNHALAVFLFLQERAAMDTRIGLTQQEIGRGTRLSVEAVRESLGWLSDPSCADALLQTPEIAPFITISKFSNAHKITLLPPYVIEKVDIRFTFDDTDQRRIKVLEEELRRIAKTKGTDRLSIYLRGDRANIVGEIESDIGRTITKEEAFLLGAICEAYGTERLKTAWRRHAPNNDRPIHAIYAMFLNKRFGQSVDYSEEMEEITYAPIVRDEHVW